MVIDEDEEFRLTTKRSDTVCFVGGFLLTVDTVFVYKSNGKESNPGTAPDLSLGITK